MTLDPVTPAAAGPGRTADRVGDLLASSTSNGLLDTAGLARVLLAEGSPDLTRAVAGGLPLLDAARLSSDLAGLGAAGRLLGQTAGLLPGPVGGVVDVVGETADPLADPAFQTRSEEAHIQRADQQNQRFLWDARGQADLDRVLAPYITTDRLLAEGRYAVHAASPADRD